MNTNNNLKVNAFLIDKVLKNFSGLPDKEVKEKLAGLKREKVRKPVIYVGTGSCGIIAGALDTLQAVRDFLAENKTEAEVIEVGCLGLCSAEPVMEVQVPGKSRICFSNVTAEKTEGILAAVLSNTVDPAHVLGQYRTPGVEEWSNIPHLDEHPWFAYQVRHLLQNAGFISPFSIEDYLSHGGYKSFYKSILNYTADKVCDIIDQSELRGRGGGGFPTGKKWKVALNTGSDQKFLICNADESDPGAFMDRAVIEGDPQLAAELARQTLLAGLDPLETVNQGLVPGIQYTGEQFSIGEMFLPDLMLAAEAMKQALAVLEPEMQRRGSVRQSLGRVVLGTIQGDIHEIGKNLVGTLLSANGFEVFDLGVDVSPQRFAQKAAEVGAGLVGVSALLTTTMVRQKEVIGALAGLGLRPQVKVMVGGAPVTRRWAEQIGADGYSEDALGAVTLAKSLLKA